MAELTPVPVGTVASSLVSDDKDKIIANSIADAEGLFDILDAGIEWTQKEEKALVRRLDMLIMPLLIFGFFVLQLDRGNSGNALTDFFLKEVGINQFQFNVGNQLMYTSITIFEIPFNLILYRIGPALWITVQILAWGSVACLQVFIRGKGAGAWYATRFLLGLCEAGYIPAALYTITRFYTIPETSKRFAIFFLGNMGANGASGLLAYGILHMRGIAGLSGWQWLFLLEGLLTIVACVLFVVLFPQSTSKPVSVFNIRFFSDHDGQILTARVLRNDSTKIHVRQHVTREEFKATVTNWKLIGHVLTAICCLSATTSLFAYAPSIVASYNYDRLKSNAMVSIGYWIMMVMAIIWGFVADKWGRRGPMVFADVFIGFILIIANRCIVDLDNNTAKFAVLTLIISFSFVWHPINASWMALNTRTAGERSVTMAIFVMAANASGIVSGQIFQAKDAPRYRTAWTATLILSSVGIVIAAWTNFQYWWLNRRNARQGIVDFVYKP